MFHIYIFAASDSYHEENDHSHIHLVRCNLLFAIHAILLLGRGMSRAIFQMEGFQD
jgi:hypothetical protein